MENLLASAGRWAGVVGILLCVGSVILRFLGYHDFVGFQMGTILQAGTSATVIGCFLLLLARVDHR